MGGGEVHRRVAVEAGQQLHERLDESGGDAAHRIVLVVSAAVIVSTVVQLKSEKVFSLRIHSKVHKFYFITFLPP